MPHYGEQRRTAPETEPQPSGRGPHFFSIPLVRLQAHPHRPRRHPHQTSHRPPRQRQNAPTGNNPIDYLAYAPYGEQRSGPAAEGEKFATYYRDQTGLDYANQRYYSSAWGRFGAVDPAMDGNNHYAYSLFDPVNHSDPSGLSGCGPTNSTAPDPSGVCPPGSFWYTSSSQVLVLTPNLQASQIPTNLQPAYAWALTFLGYQSPDFGMTLRKTPLPFPW
ncbi:MAG: RHS repeat-associated core domain-containing protein [Bryobacterales bacterium]|nr:RHS repeat-associated core domain-containing protein [Bryobacterales bacterium]